MTPYLALAASILIGVGGQVCLKLGANAGSVTEQFLRWQTIAGLLLYVVSGIIYIIAVRRMLITSSLMVSFCEQRETIRT